MSNEAFGGRGLSDLRDHRVTSQTVKNELHGVHCTTKQKFAVRTKVCFLGLKELRCLSDSFIGVGNVTRRCVAVKLVVRYSRYTAAGALKTPALSFPREQTISSSSLSSRKLSVSSALAPYTLLKG